MKTDMHPATSGMSAMPGFVFPRPLRNTLYVFLVVTCAVGAWLCSTASAPESFVYRIGAHALIALSGFAAMLAFPPLRSGRIASLVIIISALIVRAAFWSMPVSDDVNRYLWEGKLVAQGVSPYQARADDERYSGYRDAYWEQMNHKDRLTAYPPLITGLNALLTRIEYHPRVMKITYTLFDLATLGLVMILLVRYRRPLRYALIYALNPIVLFAFAGEAHFDSTFIFFCLAAVLAFAAGKQGLAWAALGIAFQCKWLAVILAPWMIMRSRKGSFVWFLPTAFLPFLFIHTDVLTLLRGLYEFGAATSFNAPLHGLVRAVGADTETASWITWAVFGIWTILVARLQTHVVRATVALWVGFILCSSVVHFWYLAWLAPVMVFTPTLSWLWLSVASSVYYLAGFRAATGGVWSLPPWTAFAQWLPFVALLCYENRHAISRLRHRRGYRDARSYALVLPTYNDTLRLERCLRTISAQSVAPREIFVVDGGSVDDPGPICTRFGARLLRSQPGRGRQIAAGVSVCTADIIGVVHADSQLGGMAGESALRYFERNPDTPAGALGQRFDSSGVSLTVIECLNDMRVITGGTVFGDQVLFFRRNVIEYLHGFPAIDLMEDVECSLRLQTVGEIGLIDYPAVSSSRSWRLRGFVAQTTRVLVCMLRYRLARMRGRDISAELYSYYYRNDRVSG